jgi:hypothetical protein
MAEQVANLQKQLRIASENLESVIEMLENVSKLPEEEQANLLAIDDAYVEQKISDIAGLADDLSTSIMEGFPGSARTTMEGISLSSTTTKTTKPVKKKKKSCRCKRSYDDPDFSFSSPKEKKKRCCYANTSADTLARMLYFGKNKRGGGEDELL